MMILSGFDTNNNYEAAFEVLCEENYERVYKKAMSILLDSEMAEEAAQETFIKAFLKINTLKDKSKFSPWVCAIAANVCKRMLQQKIIFRDRNVSIYDDNGNIKNNITELINFIVPDKIYEDEELRRRLKQCIGELDKETQQIINMRFSCELSVKEIAEALGLKEGTVKSRIYRAKQKIANKLREFIDVKGMRSSG